MSDKVQGSTVKKHDVPERPTPESAKYKGRNGWGGGFDSYAYAVKSVLDQARHTKGSESGFLGKEKQLLNPKEAVDRQMLHKKKK